MTEFRTAREWLAEADFDALNTDLFSGLVEKVGYDKAVEVRAALKRVSENTLDALGVMRMSAESVMKLQRAVASIVVDTYLPVERHDNCG